MTGMFELFTDSDASYRFRLTAPDGTVMALSRPFPDKQAAVAGIAAVREYAGTGLVTDISATQNQATAPSAAAEVPPESGPRATRPGSSSAAGRRLSGEHKTFRWHTGPREAGLIGVRGGGATAGWRGGRQ
jgi:uncharacterized protein YegP (UPF0339 family)